MCIGILQAESKYCSTLLFYGSQQLVFQNMLPPTSFNISCCLGGHFGGPTRLQDSGLWPQGPGLTAPLGQVSGCWGKTRNGSVLSWRQLPSTHWENGYHPFITLMVFIFVESIRCRLWMIDNPFQRLTVIEMLIQLSSVSLHFRISCIASLIAGIKGFLFCGSNRRMKN